jgi:hypothetical protein
MVFPVPDSPAKRIASPLSHPVQVFPAQDFKVIRDLKGTGFIDDLSAHNRTLLLITLFIIL